MLCIFRRPRVSFLSLLSFLSTFSFLLWATITIAYVSRLPNSSEGHACAHKGHMDAWPPHKWADRRHHRRPLVPPAPHLSCLSFFLPLFVNNKFSSIYLRVMGWRARHGGERSIHILDVMVANSLTILALFLIMLSGVSARPYGLSLPNPVGGLSSAVSGTRVLFAGGSNGTRPTATLCFDANSTTPAFITACSNALSAGRNDMAAYVVGSEVLLPFHFIFLDCYFFDFFRCFDSCDKFLGLRPTTVEVPSCSALHMIVVQLYFRSMSLLICVLVLTLSMVDISHRRNTNNRYDGHLRYQRWHAQLESVRPRRRSSNLSRCVSGSDFDNSNRHARHVLTPYSYV